VSGPSRFWTKSKCANWKRINADRHRLFEIDKRTEISDCRIPIYSLAWRANCASSRIEVLEYKELEMCAALGVAIVIGAPYASGILVRGAGPGALYRYAPAEPAIIAKAQRVAEVCRRHAVPLAAAALQFPLGHRSVVSVIPGPVAAEEVRLNLAWMRRDLPDALWAAPRPRAIRARAGSARRHEQLQQARPALAALGVSFGHHLQRDLAHADRAPG
jgi:aryl-alcohol dehydrogenase-like predicted oxidoreductase